MHLKKIILVFILNLSCLQVWAEEEVQNSADSPSTETTDSTTKPPVTLPQDQEDLDAAPDDQASEVIPNQ